MKKAIFSILAVTATMSLFSAAKNPFGAWPFSQDDAKNWAASWATFNKEMGDLKKQSFSPAAKKEVDEAASAAQKLEQTVQTIIAKGPASDYSISMRNGIVSYRAPGTKAFITIKPKADSYTFYNGILFINNREIDLKTRDYKVNGRNLKDVAPEL